MLSGGTNVSLTGARRRPAHEVVRPARLVVRARRAAAAERLLADDGAGRLVVDVEVAGREAQLVVRERDRRRARGRRPTRSARTATCRRTARGSPRSGRRRTGRRVRHGPEELALHDVEVRIGRLDDRRLDEPALAVVACRRRARSRRSRALRASAMASRQPRERATVDHGAHERCQVGHVALADLARPSRPPARAPRARACRGCTRARLPSTSAPGTRRSRARAPSRRPAGRPRRA